MMDKEFSDPLIEKLKLTMEKRNLSPERAAPFLEISFRTIYRWLNYENQPSKPYRKLIKTGIRRIERLK